ncbi:hypothetical protein scyTo_0004341 [Scyliorhinus torazame]|uniref:RNase H type-1 domain-containing protein n=1 Tax=Scyliorhinus torazame TaxID=75743 RepID=A0A401NQD5_SCYTO|nr:hypothetical protein [Scyliorhinus torazame]
MLGCYILMVVKSRRTKSNPDGHTLLKKSGDKVVEKQGIIIGSAQTAEFEGILQGLKEYQKRQLQETTIVTDSFFVQQGSEKELAFWKLNGWINSKHKRLEEKERLEKIEEILANYGYPNNSSKARAKGTGELLKGNQEVDETLNVHSGKHWGHNGRASNSHQTDT